MAGHEHEHGHQQDWRDRLRARGQRLTPQRETVLAAVGELGHATPDEVLSHVREQAPRLNVSTVYRSLEVLEELGLVRHTHLAGRAPTFHATTDDHDGGHFHLVCRNCGRVTSVDPGTAAPLQAALREQEGFEMDVGHLSVFGVCAGGCGA